MSNLRVYATSDLHGYLPEDGVVPECDLFLIAGDVCPVWDHHFVTQRSWLEADFTSWLDRQPADKIIGIGGNHDFALASKTLGDKLPWTYLLDETYEYLGLKIHGSPYTPTFFDWEFMEDDEPNKLGKHWELIPDDVDILMTHGPAYGLMDESYYPEPGTHAGSRTLGQRLGELQDLQAFVFGHIHGAAGRGGFGARKSWGGFTRAYNVSRVNEDYKPVNPIMEIQIEA